MEKITIKFKEMGIVLMTASVIFFVIAVTLPDFSLSKLTPSVFLFGLGILNFRFR